VSAIVLRIDRETARHLAIACRRHRQVGEQLGHEIPAGVADLEAFCVEIASTSDHGRSRAITSQAVRDDRAMTQSAEWLSAEQAAQTAGLSIATVRRRIADGSLASSKVGRSRRIRRRELDRFMEGRC
jgi:excisionase family DNA binding protein